MKGIFKSSLALLALIVLSLALATQHGRAPVNLTFEKSGGAGGVWHGTVAGDVVGTLTTVALTIDDTNPVWQVEFDFIVSAGAYSFTARLSGMLNSNTGMVVMNGVVTEGYLEGARVHEQGQLVAVDELTGETTFEGIIRVMTGSTR